MRKLFIVLVLCATTSLSTACLATRKFTRGEVKTSADTLSSKIDSTETELKGEIKETRDSVDRVDKRVTTVDGRVTEVDSKATQTAQGLNTLKTDVQGVDQKAVKAQGTADKAVGDVNTLGDKFLNRNQYAVAAEKSVQFKFNSDKLESNYKEALDEIAMTLTTNPNAIVVMEGRTDSRGDSDYNVKLGERRVESVRRYLAVEKQVPVYKIHQISLGAARPVASNESKEGREQNRAVTLMVLIPKVDSAVASSGR